MSYCVMFYYCLLACSFLMRDRKGKWIRIGGEVGRTCREWGQPVMRIYYVREEYIFSKRKNNNLHGHKYSIGVKVLFFEDSLYNL